MLACPKCPFQLKELHSSVKKHMTSKLNSIERDARVMALCDELIEIEQRLIPTGLHVFGRAAELQEKADLLRMVASFDRPEHGARALPTLVADALG
ncbi:MAG: cobaltochelatase subunit CobN, partial [Pyrinomonadaceae bacterium]